ncbi:MAG: hypothetical protein EON52_13755 [Actinomycetales bacterium]|nr:MAG: hypothetical protein EON52_13755 [Actinomycetales bacterium]
MKHEQAHELAGKAVAVTVRHDRDGEATREVVFVVEDWWDRVYGDSWMNANGNPAAMLYGIRGGFAGLPVDDEVVYGHVAGAGQLVHVSELGEVRS